jgi:hypothetical protein
MRLRNFGAARRAADKGDLDGEFRKAEGREFVEQDKGPAAQYGIFSGLLNELAAVSDGGGS